MKFSPNDSGASEIVLKRYDRLESRYLQTGDFSALQEMNTEYPIETRTLIEKVLQLGEVSDPRIHNRFLMFYQDSTLQTLLADVESEYANVDDLTRKFQDAFSNLNELIPGIKIPELYLQIGAFDQSIIVGDKSVGVCLDKYMGEKYPLYKKYYTAQQLKTMKRCYIVPDCLCFYLLGQYPMENFEMKSQVERDIHVAKVMWVVNKVTGEKKLQTAYLKNVEKYMLHNKNASIDDFLRTDEDYGSILKCK